MTQFIREQASDSEEVVTPLMLDGTYLSRNFATLGPELPHENYSTAVKERKDAAVVQVSKPV